MTHSEEMHAFVQVVELGSFSRAAEALGITPSALSKLVNRLEHRLGVKLLHRTTRKLALTSEGDLYVPRAKAILADIAELETDVAKSHATPFGLLRVNTSNGFGLHQLAPALPDFADDYPDIQVELSITDRIVDLTVDKADIAIRVGAVVDETLVARKLAELRRIVCAAPAYLERHGMPRQPADIARHRCVGMAFQTPSHWAFHEPGGGMTEVRIAPAILTDNGDAALRLAIEGAGIVRLADIIVGGPIARGQLVPLFPETHAAEPLPILALFHPGRQRLPKLRVFLEFLERRFAHAPWRIEASAPVP
jgi:DNA-binding transcriptional LysR family regulator